MCLSLGKGTFTTRLRKTASKKRHAGRSLDYAMAFCSLQLLCSVVCNKARLRRIVTPPHASEISTFPRYGFTPFCRNDRPTTPTLPILLRSCRFVCKVYHIATRSYFFRFLP